MSDNWNTYATSIDNKLASFLLDMEPWQNGENEHLDHSYRLSVTLNEPNEDGLTSQCRRNNQKNIRNLCIELPT